MNKRDFLKLFGSVALSSNIGISFAKSPEKNINLIVVFLRGGADGISMLVPYNDQYYYQSREKVSIKKSDCIQVNDTFGFHKKLNFINSLYLNNQLALIPLAGQVNNSRSHFQAQDVMEYGINNITTYKSGFLARLAEVTSKKPISFTENISPILIHDKFVTTNIASSHISGAFHFSGTPRLEDKKLVETFKIVKENMSIVNEIKDKKIDTSKKLFAASKFMLAGGYNVSFIDFDDWDTHSNQVTRLNSLLSNLDSELQNLKMGLGDAEWSKTAVVIMSEFGRVIKENGLGTDHGHGNLMMVTGGLVNKSKIHGDWITLKKENLHEGRDLPVIHEYRDILAELLTKAYSLSRSQIDYVFPSANPTKFNII